MSNGQPLLWSEKQHTKRGQTNYAHKGEKCLWILTEERPKKEVLEMIFQYFAKDQNFGFLGGELKIIPILDENQCFDFTYEVFGFQCNRVNRVFIKTVSGNSSFTDFLVYYQNEMPQPNQPPLYAIEETKTDDKESRNTGVFQRCSKFVYIQNFFPTTKMVMLYALQVGQKAKPTETYIFGTRLLLTLGVDILGKVIDSNIFVPFTSVDEVIEYKNRMRKAHAGNVPILFNKQGNKIQISGRLYKSGSLSHDPNIGALSIIGAVLRKLGWKGQIEITQHGLMQSHVRNAKNKFILIANQLGMSLQGLTIPKAQMPDAYWHYDMDGEKLGTIFIHLVIENFTESFSVFENHAGCEKGYFQTPNGEHIPLAKYTDRNAYKAGDKDQIVFIPDLVLIDIKEKESITIEGKKFENMRKGIEELKGYDAFENMYLKKYYPAYKVVRTVVLYGSHEQKLIEVEVGFLLNRDGKLILGIKAPKLFTRAIKNLLDYWK
ncbi:MAG: hypothetical protein MJZ92_00485 [Paludibacteraceae bacterium]|nr:hypothetical protein [Paludibacteraceae bacterium]